MKTRTTIITIAALAVLALSATAFAGPGYGRGGGNNCPNWGSANGPGQGQGPGMMRQGGQGGPGYGMGPGMIQGRQLTPEQYEKLQSLAQEFGDKAEALNKKLFAKDAELDAAYAAEKIDVKKVKSLAVEVGNLRGDLFELRAEYRAQLISEGIIDNWHGGRGVRGGRSGRGFGPGMGFGPGNCLGFAQGLGPNAMADDTP